MIGTVIANKINGWLLKPLFERARPTDVILRIPKEESFSFPSGHTVNAFFIAMFLGLFFPRLRIPMFLLATLTGLSRIYCGVHFPTDVLAGAIVGMVLAYLFQKMLTRSRIVIYFLTFLISFQAFAVDDPTGGKPFFPWVWQDQLKPTIIKAFDKTGLIIAASGAASSIVVHEYDRKVFDYTEDDGNLLMSESSAKNFGKLGNGVAGLSITVAQLLFDQNNGLKTAQALIFTSVSHISIAGLVRRNRPGNRSDFLPFPSSFPSGHTSSAFAMAGSMAYSYGWKGAIPGYFLASAIALSRIKEGRHWASDIVGGAFLGTFWARASFEAESPNKNPVVIVPARVGEDGMMVSAIKQF